MNLFIHPTFSHEPLLRTSYRKPVRNNIQSSFQELLRKQTPVAKLSSTPNHLCGLSFQITFILFSGDSVCLKVRFT